MRSWKKLAVLSLLTAMISIGSGLATAGVIDIEGDIQLHIKPQLEAVIQGGPSGGTPVDGPFSGPEPYTVAFSVCCAFDPDGGQLFFEWDFSYDGSNFNVEATGPGPIEQTWDDGPSQRFVALRVTSTSIQPPVVITEMVTVNSVAPTIQLLNGPYSGQPGASIAFSATATDPSVPDTTAEFVYKWDFDYDGSFDPSQSGLELTDVSHTYTEPRTYTLAVRAVDKDGAQGQLATAEVAVTETVTLAASADTWLEEEHGGDDNYGNTTSLHISPDEHKNRRTLVKFDLSALPNGAVIDDAKLKLHASTVPASSRTLGAHRVTADWQETGVAWDTQPTTLFEYTNTVGAPSSAGPVTWEVTADVQLMVDGTEPNYGWLAEDVDEDFGNSSDAMEFSSREHATAAERPVLEVTYRLP